MVKNKREQIWVDPLFKETLEKLKAQRVINGNPVKNFPELTKEIIESENFKKVVDEVLNKIVNNERIRFDKKRLW